MKTIQGIILLAFLGAIGLFAVQNMQTVIVRFAAWNLTAPLAAFAVVVYLAGMVSGWTVVSFLRRSINRVTAPRE